MRPAAHTAWMRVRSEAAALASWWLHEMFDLGRALLALLAPRLARRVAIRFSTTECAVTSAHGGSTSLRVARDEGGEWPSSLEALDPAARLHETDALLMLAPEDVLIEELSLPQSLERNLEQVIALHAERNFPLLRDRIVFDYRILRRNRKLRTLAVRIFIAHRERVDFLRRLAERWGFHPIRIATVNEDGEPCGNFLPTGTRSNIPLSMRLDRRAALASVALLVLWVGVVSGQWAYERIVVGRAATHARAAAAKVDALETQLREASIAAVALAKQIDAPDALDVLTELTRTVPDDSWVFDLEIDAPGSGAPAVKVGAFSPAAQALAQTLEGSARFADVKIDLAIPAGVIANKDRLRLTAAWEPVAP